MRRRKPLSARLLIPVVLSAALTLAGGASGRAEGDVYRLVVVATQPGGTQQWTEWVAPDSGRWRLEEGGKTYIYTGPSYAIIDRRQGAHVRTGSAPFLGSLPNRAATREPLRAYLAGSSDGVEVKETIDGNQELRFRRSTTPIVATIAEKLSNAEAVQRKLFVIPAEEVTSSATERPVGARPRLAVRSYWLGPAFSGRRAITAVEHYAGPRASRGGTRDAPGESFSYHVTFYELPSAQGKTSASPGQRAPSGELQVLSQALTSTAAQRTLRVYNGSNGNLRTAPWPRASVTLRLGGEKVTVIPDRTESTGKLRAGFAVLTRTTLVTVVGKFRLNAIPAAASQLRAM